MSSRDPETGQFVSSGNRSMTYADHDVHWVRHALNFDDGADSGPDTVTNDIRRFEITSRGLDPDELAELRLLTIDASLKAGGTPIDQDEIGSVTAAIDYGYNLDGTEFLSATPNTEGIDVDDSGTDDYIAQFRDTDEVGQLGAHTLSMYPGYSDTTDGTGGSGSCPHFRFSFPLAAHLGTGPVVDSVDDFCSRIRLVINNMVADAAVDVKYGLYYAVEESESGRTRFGR